MCGGSVILTTGVYCLNYLAISQLGTLSAVLHGGCRDPRPRHAAGTGTTWYSPTTRQADDRATLHIRKGYFDRSPFSTSSPERDPFRPEILSGIVWRHRGSHAEKGVVFRESQETVELLGQSTRE
jgi:hypothetical protein